MGRALSRSGNYRFSIILNAAVTPNRFCAGNSGPPNYIKKMNSRRLPNIYLNSLCSGSHVISIFSFAFRRMEVLAHSLICQLKSNNYVIISKQNKYTNIFTLRGLLETRRTISEHRHCFVTKCSTLENIQCLTNFKKMIQ